MRPQLIQGDVRDVLKTLDAESIQCVVTSPPYWRLRDYGKEGQLGLEPTPEKYVKNMVDVFREVKRVLRKDGTIWLNLGDTYCGTGHKGKHTDPKHKKGRNGQKVAINNKVVGLKSKDLVGIPWRVALALQADGWYLRSDIIWQKPNPMPEPVKDRPTRSHEHIFLLSKSAKYFYDHDAIREPVKRGTPQAERDYKRMLAGRKEFDGVRKQHKTSKQQNAFVAGDPLKGRNRRDVWSITTKSYKGAHFATFPEELPEICIKAGTKVGDTVLDIFAGSGTTCAVATKLQRNSIGIELNEEYLELARKRCKMENESLASYL